MPSDAMITKYNLNRKYQVNIPEREHWEGGATLKALYTTQVNSNLVWDCVCALNELAVREEVTLERDTKGMEKPTNWPEKARQWQFMTQNPPAAERMQQLGKQSAIEWKNRTKAAGNNPQDRAGESIIQNNFFDKINVYECIAVQESLCYPYERALIHECLLQLTVCIGR
ncbi:hypothetical protein JTB14_001077 [Gonioctena quinquepunctata]|nr:hypothetical protein JTB14_001077 [Gonioctena quinquepunctata]